MADTPTVPAPAAAAPSKFRLRRVTVIPAATAIGVGALDGVLSQYVAPSAWWLPGAYRIALAVGGYGAAMLGANPNATLAASVYGLGALAAQVPQAIGRGSGAVLLAGGGDATKNTNTSSSNLGDNPTARVAPVAQGRAQGCSSCADSARALAAEAPVARIAPPSTAAAARMPSSGAF